MATTILRIEKLRKTYPNGNKEVLTGLDLTIGQGEIYGFLGPNGAGKTTTVNILAGLLKQDSGNIEIFGKPVASDRKNTMRRVGFVPQSIAIYPELTAYENLSVFGSVYGISRPELTNRIGKLLDLFGLEKFRDKKAASFSGGMKRSLNLMVGILHNPDLLILDEPTVGIDVQSKVVILEYLKTLNSHGTTILYTSHDMEEAEHLCTRVGIIDGGKLVAADSPEALARRFPECHDLKSVYLELTGKELRTMED
ncbi:MAG: ABC transporter ATP-binding protein [Bacteroidales bacterium]|nr:ABC transporter ATP-binding protein [Bacteroidales bacterium]